MGAGSFTGCSGQAPSALGAWRGAASGVMRASRWFAGDFARADGAHDIGLDHHVGRTADHQQMFDIVAADQHQAPASVDCGRIDHGEARLAAARGAPRRLGAEAAHQPGGQADQCQHHQEGDEESRGQRHFRAEQVSNIDALRHCRPRRSGGNRPNG